MSWALLVKVSEKLGLHPVSPGPHDPLSKSQTLMAECQGEHQAVGARLQSSADVNMTLRPKLSRDKSVTNSECECIK